MTMCSVKPPCYMSAFVAIDGLWNELRQLDRQGEVVKRARQERLLLTTPFFGPHAIPVMSLAVLGPAPCQLAAQGRRDIDSGIPHTKL